MNSRRTLDSLAVAIASLMLALAGCNSRTDRALNLADHSAGGDTTTAASPLVLEDEIRSDLYYLASDRLEGRGVDTLGLDLAADFIATRFQSLGLKPLPGLDGYFQPFDITTAESIDPSTRFAAGDMTYKLKDDYTALSFSAEKGFTGDVVFAGYGISSKDNHYDDYVNVDVKGKVVLAMRFEPHDGKGKSRWGKDDWTPNAHLETKARAAEEHGAVALLLVNPPSHHNPLQDDLLPFSREYVGGGISIPVLHVTRTVADALLKRGDTATLKELQARIDQNAKPASVALKDVSTQGKVAIKRSKRTVKNVAACLPGAGPTAEEYVIIGSHYDHLGWGGPASLMSAPTLNRVPGITEPGAGNPHAPATNPHSAATRPTAPATRAIHHGADDNASGTVAMLELARIFSHRPAPPTRTIVFAAFTAEESGLFGSARFVNKSPIDLKKVAAMLNLDMVGRIRKNLLYVGGGGTAAPLKNILKVADLHSPLEFKNFGDGGLGPSDHMSFAIKKVPVLFLFSGTHEDYHRPTDTPDKINYDGIADVARMSVGLVDDLAQMTKAPYVDAADQHTMMSPSAAATGGETQGRRATLGVIPQYGEEEDGKGVKISGTSADTPAQKAGLQDGDVITKLGDQPTTTLMELSAVLASHKPGDKVKVVYQRAGKQQSVDVTLGERK